MAVLIPRTLAEYILLGPTGDRRQLQDSPILGDVWIAFATEPGPQELLITPHKSKTAGETAIRIDEEVSEDRTAHGTQDRAPPEIAYLQGVVAARLHFDEVLRIVVPMTSWWNLPSNQHDIRVYHGDTGSQRIDDVLKTVQQMVEQWSVPNKKLRPIAMPSTLDRYTALAGINLWAHSTKLKIGPDNDKAPARLAAAIKKENSEIKKLLVELFWAIVNRETRPRGCDGSLVYQISLNRQADLAIDKSVPSVKADAAGRLFQVNCEKIAWAVIDSGIQGAHDCFKDKDGKSRVVASFDFSNYRKIVNLDNLRIFGAEANPKRQDEILGILLREDLKSRPSKEKAISYLTQLAQDVRFQRPIHWEFVEPFIEINIGTDPSVSDHGTHVAGIIGARKPAGQNEGADGMCPDIQLYDFRVLADSGDVKDTEFAIIAALQYIRHMNSRHDYVSVHGANLSLSIKHDVRNYACGRTPICDECEHLVESGVVVVAAAGNLGYQSFTTKEGPFESYAAFSITDPGNADGVITVGSTHRSLPHTYGVSFFSSRGPTGDGRLKPDLVAPGERIHAPFRQGWGDLDGTSMAAPHVSGAAAMLLARYPEFIRQPRKIKRILCETATDLGREKSFQGNGLLDVLRAFQSI
jgi:serine protease AprX